MEHVQDFTIKNGIGIRMRRNATCQVIRLQKEKWIEIGPVYELPVEENILVWTQSSGIPSSVLAVALRVYELDNPDTQLRKLLTGKKPMQREAKPQPRRQLVEDS